MGSPIFFTIADFVMQFIQNKIICKSGPVVNIWQRYVDDVFRISEYHKVLLNLQTANSEFPARQFTHRT